MRKALIPRRDPVPFPHGTRAANFTVTVGGDSLKAVPAIKILDVAFLRQSRDEPGQWQVPVVPAAEKGEAGGSAGLRSSKPACATLQDPV